MNVRLIWLVVAFTCSTSFLMSLLSSVTERSVEISKCNCGLVHFFSFYIMYLVGCLLSYHFLAHTYTRQN
jgi:uncharacterized membrane protein